VLYVIENNQVAMSTPIEDEAPVRDLYLRAEASGLKGSVVDGNDVESVVDALLDGLTRAENNEPTILEMKTWRWEGHYVGDDQSKYRDASFRENTKDIDPVYLYEEKLLGLGIITREEIDLVHAEQEKILSDAFANAAAQEYPSKEECLDYHNIYSNDSGGAI
jgi:pyruvate dehydrogenase E1 component alpha subunit